VGAGAVVHWRDVAEVAEAAAILPGLVIASYSIILLGAVAVELRVKDFEVWAVVVAVVPGVQG
jgi:hypothetical protein